MPDSSFPAARWSLPDHPDLDWLRRRAKELRTRAAAGDPEALDLVATYDPGEGDVSLARAQRVLARAFGFAGWSKLRVHLDAREQLTRDLPAEDAADDPADRFLRLACLSYTEPPARGRAEEMAAADPALATTSAYALAACGRATELAELLRADPDAVNREGGPHRWPPLLYLCYARLDLPDADPVATLRVLIDAGADPNAGFLWHGLPSPFTAVTGVLGGGERDEPPHPSAVALATMLLDAGADPNDNQAFYNRAFRPDDDHLPPLLGHGAGRPQPSPWRDRLGTAYPSPEEMVGEHLRSAAAAGYLPRVRMLLAHGVSPDNRGYHPAHGDATAYELALQHGHPDVAALLLEAGATDTADPADLLLAAAMSGDLRAVTDASDTLRLQVVSLHPGAVRVAAEQHGTTAIGLLLQLGYSIDAADRDRRTALHQAALDGDRELCRWLLAHGADPTLTDRDFDATPAGWAEYAGHTELAEELGSGS